ncbi:MAG: hypothetical protein KGH71_00390 [Candidatus Micrarchaeota archaeon]|nr:hypothetical protein [Candidatus Micrarchaeota archaeon]
MAIQQKSSGNMVPIYSDEQALKIAKKLTTPQIAAVYYLKGPAQRMHTPGLVEFKKELQSHGIYEKEYNELRLFLLEKSLIEVNGNEIKLTGSFNLVFEKLLSLAANNRAH